MSVLHLRTQRHGGIKYTHCGILVSKDDRYIKCYRLKQAAKMAGDKKGFICPDCLKIAFPYYKLEDVQATIKIWSREISCLKPGQFIHLTLGK
jgi:hypothetical protein